MKAFLQACRFPWCVKLLYLVCRTDFNRQKLARYFVESAFRLDSVQLHKMIPEQDRVSSDDIIIPSYLVFTAKTLEDIMPSPA